MKIGFYVKKSNGWGEAGVIEKIIYTAAELKSLKEENIKIRRDRTKNDIHRENTSYYSSAWSLPSEHWFRLIRALTLNKYFEDEVERLRAKFNIVVSDTEREILTVMKEEGSIKRDALSIKFNDKRRGKIRNSEDDILKRYEEAKAKDAELQTAIESISKNFSINPWLLRDKNSISNIVKYGVVCGGNFDGIFHLEKIWDEDSPESLKYIGVSIKILRNVKPGVVHEYIEQNWANISSILSEVMPREELYDVEEDELLAVSLRESQALDHNSIAKKLKQSGYKGKGVRDFTQKASRDFYSKAKKKINALFQPRYKLHTKAKK